MQNEEYERKLKQHLNLQDKTLTRYIKPGALDQINDLWEYVDYETYTLVQFLVTKTTKERFVRFMAFRYDEVNDKMLFSTDPPIYHNVLMEALSQFHQKVLD